LRSVLRVAPQNPGTPYISILCIGGNIVIIKKTYYSDFQKKMIKL